MTPEMILTIGFVAAIGVALEVLPVLRSMRKRDELKKAAHQASLRAQEAGKRANVSREESKKKVAESQARYENSLRAAVKHRQDLANRRLSASKAERAELEKEIRTIEESLDFFKQQLEKERNMLRISLNENREDLTKRESGAKNNLTEAEIMGLDLFEFALAKELLRIEQLLAIIESSSKI